MKENKYDDDKFFEQYRQMPRSIGGLQAAGEWYMLRQMLPDMKEKRVLDLGCGFGWHCQYAAEQGALSVTGIDLSEKMLVEAKKKNAFANVEYICAAIEDVDFSNDSFDVVISSLAFHYVKSFKEVCEKINALLIPGGWFVFSVEHPVFTAQGRQDWYYDNNGNIKHWPVDHYFDEGKRVADFLGEDVVKYHKTFTTYVNTLLQTGFELKSIVEPEPDPELLKLHPEWNDELRRPMFLLIAAQKK